MVSRRLAGLSSQNQMDMRKQIATGSSSDSCHHTTYTCAVSQKYQDRFIKHGPEISRPKPWETFQNPVYSESGEGFCPSMTLLSQNPW